MVKEKLKFILVHFLKNNKLIFLFNLYLFLISVHAKSQNLEQIKLTKADSLNGVLYKFSCGQMEVEISLFLKKDKTFYLQIDRPLGMDQWSDGQWKLKNDTLVLKSNIQKNDLPVKIEYTKKGDFIDSFQIAVVKNLKGEPLTEVFVYVNNDSIKCIPLVGQCNQLFKKINKVKLEYENGISSSWINVNKDEKKFLLIVLTSKNLSKYLTFENKKYKIKDGILFNFFGESLH